MPARLPASALRRSSWALTRLRNGPRPPPGVTLGVATARYLDAKRDRLRPDTYKAATRYFAVHWKPLHDRPLDDIERADVAARLQELTKAHGRTSAARARGNLSALFSGR